MWELLTARRLFAGSALQSMSAICEGERVPPSAVAGALPAGLDAVVLRALAVEPSVRAASAAEMLDEVESVAERAGVLLSRSRAGRWVRGSRGAP